MQFKNIFLAAAAAACASAQAIPSLTAALNSTEELSALFTLLGSYPELTATLANMTNTTIFAPSNDALEELMAQDGFEALAATEGYIESLLMYHVVNSSLASVNITTDAVFVPTLLNDTMYANVTGGQVVGLVRSGEGDNATAQVISGLAQRSNITTADVRVSTGYVHIIDQVLTLPQNVTTTAINTNLTGFAGAVIYADLETTLDTAKNITVFAPSTEAFEAIASAFDTITPEMLGSILQYHVINSTVAYSSLISDMQVDALDGNQLNITVVDSGIYVNSARVIAADILISGGVLHVIDAVLNPASMNEVDSDADNSPSNFGNATAGDISTLTDDVPTATTTIAVISTVTVNPQRTTAGTTSTEGAATMPTGAVGAAALFGGLAILAQL